MKILTFDTSNNTVSVAVSENSNILSYVQDYEPSTQAEKLIPFIETALKQANIRYQDLEYLGVTCGPGSFTGIRVGLACAKGLLVNSRLKATVVTNFEIAFYRATQQATNWDKIIILLNAYRNQLYVQIFDKKGFNEPSLLNYNESINLIKIQNSKETIICAGNGAHLIYKDILSLSNISILPRFPKIKALHICRYLYETIDFRKAMPIEPLYIRPPDAKL